jgi:hypothetical protein
VTVEELEDRRHALGGDASCGGVSLPKKEKYAVFELGKVEKVYTEKTGCSLLRGYVNQEDLQGNCLKGRSYFEACLRR